MDAAVIRERVKKLMAYAGDGSASEGEIDTAMRLAAKLIDLHHLDPDDLEDDIPEAKAEFGKAEATTCNTKLSTWESTLSAAVKQLFGCVSCYISHNLRPIRRNGITQTDREGRVKRGRTMVFYGPADDAREAAELFKSWSLSIATMGVARWGGCFKGDGAMYCMGFAEALWRKASEINVERLGIQARPARLLPNGSKSTAITLADRYTKIVEQSKDWLQETHGVKLSGRGGGGGYRAGSEDAFNEGHQHGKAANFARAEKRKLLQ